MGEHETWFSLLPGFKNLEAAIGHQLGKSVLDNEPVGHLGHVATALLAFALILFFAVSYRKKLDAAGDGGVVPASHFGPRAVVEIVGEAALSIMAGVMGEKAARRFLPLIGSLAFFILFSNLLGLVPGFTPPTDNLNTTVACASIIFVATHAYGVAEHGLPYFKHFLGPVWWLAPLMLPIELVSHLARPMSLSLRLMGNMMGDHKVLGIFLGLVPLLVPLPIMALGIIVCIVQTLVFCLLSTVYISMAIEHHEGEHEHDDGHGHVDHGQAQAHAH